MTISLTVIVIELTNEMTYLLPIMLTITTSQWVGNLFTVSMVKQPSHSAHWSQLSETYVC